MSWIHRLERRLEPYAITNLTLLLVIGQAFVLLTSLIGLIDPGLLLLVPVNVVAGEWWRVFSFLFIPPPLGPIWSALSLYVFYLYGSALEQLWGALRYNLFILSGYILTISLSFLAPYSVTTNVYLLGVVFLAFAWLNPNFELLLFFVIPVKVKWLAAVTWLLYAFEFSTSGLSTKLAIGAAAGNFLLFLGGDVLRSLRQKGSTPAGDSRGRSKSPSAAEARHTCSVCGRTDVTNPQLDFRYANDDQCYCSDHLPSRKSASSSVDDANSPSI